MASYIEKGDSLFIPFRNGVSISDSQCRPRIYKSLQNFEKSFPKHNHGEKNIEVVEYAEVKHGEWNDNIFGFSNVCMECGAIVERTCIKNNSGELNYCPNCGAKMDGVRKEQ